MAQYKSNVPQFAPVIIDGYTQFKDYYLSCEMQTKEWLVNNLNENSVFIDIGANVGILTLTAGKVIGNEGKIIAIEPTSTFELLAQNLKRAENQHTTPTMTINKAIGIRTENRRDSLYKIWGEEPETANWEFVSLDDLVKELECNKIDVIKIDVDGYELEVLQGAIKTLNTFQPKVLIEINQALNTRGVTSRAIFDFMIDARYTNVLALDEENYLFSSNWKPGDPWPNYLIFSTYRKELSQNLDKGQELSKKFKIRNLSKENEFIQNERSNKGELPAWSYINLIETDFQSSNVPVIARVKGNLHQGSISALVVSESLTEKISPEPHVNKAGEFEFNINCEFWTNKLILRTYQTCAYSFQIHEVKVYEAISQGKDYERVSDRSFESIQTFTSTSRFFKKIFSSTSPNLEKELFLHESHQGWLMEQSSASLFREIVRFTKPNFFLEIGTWEGFSSSIVLSNSDATIYSLDSSSRIDFTNYSSRYVDFDIPKVVETGWLAASLDKENRFHLVTADSTKFNWETFPNDFFDLAFIDGGHEFEVVASDTSNVIPKLKKGGICIWDDFNFYGDLIASNEQEIYNYFIDSIEELKNIFDFYFVIGTQFLIGRKK